MSESKSAGKLGYCVECGESLWTTVDHRCPDPGRRYDRRPQTATEFRLVNALVLADAELSGREPLEPGRAAAAVRRAIRSLGVGEEHLLYFLLPTSAEACPPVSWDEFK